ncbi:MAG: acetyl-CoA carboxylase, carboxyltransferase subunit beta [Peptostreptococcus porci]|nr:acetyl-CoA carboxylase, carboxyltransferase subunit beta [Peptostreptococcus porci]MDY5436677.1 acetyl-CoA carboxylase, carboxyltransferase subunit beta [Peptostreptococcus porci]
MEHFKKKKYKPASNINIQPDVLIKCPECSNMIFKNDLSENLKICPTCGKYLKMNARERLKQILDKDSFVEYFRDKNIRDPLKFPKYKEKQLVLRKVLNQDEAAVCGVGKIDGNRIVIAVMDTQFMMGSMGSTVGEKITKAVELSIKKKIPLIIFTASGGARMQEGMFSLMQMAKTSQAIARHSEKGLLYISVMTDPTTGGVSASFASLGDIIIAKKNALIGFAGQRVIEQVTRTKLPEGFQRAEFLLKHGLIDMVVERNVLRETLSDILSIHLNVRKKR